MALVALKSLGNHPPCIGNFEYQISGVIRSLDRWRSWPSNRWETLRTQSSILCSKLLHTMTNDVCDLASATRRWRSIHQRRRGRWCWWPWRIHRHSFESQTCVNCDEWCIGRFLKTATRRWCSICQEKECWWRVQGDLIGPDLKLLWETMARF